MSAAIKTLQMHLYKPKFMCFVCHFIVVCCVPVTQDKQCTHADVVAFYDYLLINVCVSVLGGGQTIESC